MPHDELDWPGLLKDLSREVSEADNFRRYLPDQAIADEWLGFPIASQLEIENAEARLGTQFPPSYRSFLQITNSRMWAGPFVAFLWSALSERTPGVTSIRRKWRTWSRSMIRGKLNNRELKVIVAIILLSVLSVVMYGCARRRNSEPSPSVVPVASTTAAKGGSVPPSESRPKAESASIPLTFPLTTAEVNTLNVFDEPVQLVMHVKFTPSDMEQYFASSRDCAAVLFFKDGRYNHKVALWQPPAAPPALSSGAVEAFDNKYVKLGTRHGPFYLGDFTGNGLTQVFLLYESGMGWFFAIYGYSGRQITREFIFTIDNTYVRPIQTLQAGMLKLFPQKDKIESLSGTPKYRYRFRLKYLVYRWNSKTWSYEKAETGSQLVWADPTTRMTYPIPGNSSSER